MVSHIAGLRANRSTGLQAIAQTRRAHLKVSQSNEEEKRPTKATKSAAARGLAFNAKA
jgi:hypothetical protein